MTLPKEIVSGFWKAGHVQGLAVDIKHGRVHYSFTTILINNLEEKAFCSQMLLHRMDKSDPTFSFPGNKACKETGVQSPSFV